MKISVNSIDDSLFCPYCVVLIVAFLVVMQSDRVQKYLFIKKHSIIILGLCFFQKNGLYFKSV